MQSQDISSKAIRQLNWKSMILMDFKSFLKKEMTQRMSLIFGLLGVLHA